MQITHFLAARKGLDQQTYELENARARLVELIDNNIEKPFHIENQQNRELAYWASWFFNLISACLAFYFLYQFSVPIFSDPYLAAILPIVGLVIWELMKRSSINALASKYFKTKGTTRRRLSMRRLFVIIVLVGGSYYATMDGGRQAMEDFTYAPPLTDIDSIANHYESQIAGANAQLDGMRNSDGVIWWEMRIDAKLIEDQITVLRQEKLDAIQNAKTDNDEKLKTFDYETKIDAWQFGICAGLVDLALVCTIFFLCYCARLEYDFVAGNAPNLVAQVRAQFEHDSAQLFGNLTQVPAQTHAHTPAQVVRTLDPHQAPTTQQTASKHVVVQGFINRAQTHAQVVRKPPAQVVHTQVVQQLKGYEYSRHHSQRGVVEGKIHHKTAKTDKWMTLSAVDRRIADYSNRVGVARSNYEASPTFAKKAVLENNEGWLAYWIDRKAEFYQH